MTICPIAIAVGCKKCPVFKICPVKSLIGDAAPSKPGAATATKAPAAKRAPARKKSGK